MRNGAGVSTTFAALKARNYRYYWLGLVCYVLGHRAEYVTYAWMVWELTRDPLHLGYLGLAQGVPLVLFQLYGGVLADRMNRLRLLIATQVGTAVTLGIAFAMAFSGNVRVTPLLALAALSSVFRAFDEPSRLSLLPQLINRAQLSNAIALGSIPWQAGRMIGPSIAGILIAAFGGTVGFAMAAVASVVALALYSRLRLEGHPVAGHGHNMLQQLVEGLSFVAHSFVFSALIGLALFNAVFGLSYVTLLPIFADVYFEMGARGFGWLNAAHGCGALAGTLTVATLGHAIRRPGTVLLTGATVMGTALMAFAASPTMAIAIACLVVLGYSNTFYLTQVSTFMQHNVPDHLRGRVLSIYSLCWNMLPLGGLIGGGLASAFNARVAVAVGGGMVALNALLLLTSRRLRAVR